MTTLKREQVIEYLIDCVGYSESELIEYDDTDLVNIIVGDGYLEEFQEWTN